MTNTQMKENNFQIPIIDIFAGPGGLGEGFSAFKDTERQKHIFKIALSIEMDEFAHKTLMLRSFYRQFNSIEKLIPAEYYKFIRGEIKLDDLYKLYPHEHETANKEAWRARLGNGESAVSNELVDDRIREALKGHKNFILIGGPPCQAYSLVGRSRRKQVVLNEETDERVGLYKQYLRILAVHNPAVFVMENVKGMLSAKTEESPVFEKILQDLGDPMKAYNNLFSTNGTLLECPGYRIYSLVKKRDLKNSDFIIKTENYGIPQARHRVILLGIRNDIEAKPDILRQSDSVPISMVISDLPIVRSGLSKMKDNAENWKQTIQELLSNGNLDEVDEDLQKEISKQISQLKTPETDTGGEFVRSRNIGSSYAHEWYHDEKLMGVCNHESRGHMQSDLFRYIYATSFAKIRGRSPKLADFPKTLLPNHKNVFEGINNQKFNDRFRVQLENEPSKTITSHISKDGHYYIHPDPTQCRSFTVREAARIQTFPDNYYFCGPRTFQFVQVGNAVPPLLANQIAEIVYNIANTV